MISPPRVLLQVPVTFQPIKFSPELVSLHKGNNLIGIIIYLTAIQNGNAVDILFIGLLPF